MDKCFVIQRFDSGGEYDKRYDEIFLPAIQKAGLDPYRVDRDPSSVIPIEDIVSKIRSASMILADISLDNPNIWFEVGLAVAYQKKIVLVCSDKRVGKYPFDIQQRSIINYDTKSRSSFDCLEQAITRKMIELMKTKQDITIPETEQGIASTCSLSDDCLVLLGIIGNAISGFDQSIQTETVFENMRHVGINQLGTNLAMEDLKEQSFIKLYFSYSQEYEDDEGTEFLSLTDEGKKWIMSNRSRFNTSVNPKEEKQIESTTNDFDCNNIPF